MNLGFVWTDMAFEICSPANLVIRIVRLRDDMGQVTCDTDYVDISP